MGGLSLDRKWVPLKRHPERAATVCDRKGKRFTTTLPCTLETTDDSAIVLTQSLTGEGLIRIEVEIRLPRGLKQQNARLYFQTLSYKEFANSTLVIGGTRLKVPDLTGNEWQKLPLEHLLY